MHCHFLSYLVGLLVLGKLVVIQLLSNLRLFQVLPRYLMDAGRSLDQVSYIEVLGPWVLLGEKQSQGISALFIEHEHVGSEPGRSMLHGIVRSKGMGEVIYPLPLVAGTSCPQYADERSILPLYQTIRTGVHR